MSYPDDYVESAVKHPMQVVAAALPERGRGEARIGVEMDAYYFSAKWLDVLRRSLPGASFKDAYLLVSWIRTVKSPLEIEYRRHGSLTT